MKKEYLRKGNLFAYTQVLITKGIKKKKQVDLQSLSETS